MKLRALLLGGLAPGLLIAQGNPPPGSVTGTVYDSVARRPVAGAVVQIVSTAALSGAIGSATTDARGTFEIGGLAPGAYILGFQSPALDTLALVSPERRVEIRPGARARVDLAVPAPATIRFMICGQRAADDSTSVVLGRIIDARTGEPRLDGLAEFRWQELVLDQRGVRLEPQRRSAVVGSEGFFVICDVPAVEVSAVAISGPDTSRSVTTTVPATGLLRHDFLVGGTATIRGRVVDEAGRPLPRARVVVMDSPHRTDADSAGAFTLAGIPAGSLTVGVRTLGFAPLERRLDLRHGTDTALVLQLTSLRRILDTIRVFGERVYDRDASGFQRRKRSGMGFYLDEAAIARSRAADFFQLMWRVPGTLVSERQYVRYVLLRDRRGTYCMPAVFVDGARMYREMAGDLNSFVHPDDLGGVEIYRGIQTPPEFMDHNQCGAVVIWTRPRRIIPRRPPSDSASPTQAADSPPVAPTLREEVAASRFRSSPPRRLQRLVAISPVGAG